ncbi:MAG: holo-ACP synthase [bacterium]|nr:holo-ACP synthase [bacterium]
MRVLGLGTDMVEVDRIERAVARWGEAFVCRIYTTAEIERARPLLVRGPRLAARFAAKEAVMKALGVGRRGMAWREIEILNDDQGRPLVCLHGGAQRIADQQGVVSVLVTLSHTHDHAVASAVALGN